MSYLGTIQIAQPVERCRRWRVDKAARGHSGIWVRHSEPWRQWLSVRRRARRSMLG